MPTIADMLAIGTEIAGPDGEIYKLREPNVIEMGMFQRWLEKRARESARRDSDQGPEELAKQLNIINQESAIGEYEFGGELACKALTKLEPITQLLFILLSGPHEPGKPPDYPGFTLDKAKKLMNQNVREIVAGLACKLVTDPKSVRAVLSTLGLSEEWLLRGSPTNTDGPKSNSGDSPIPTSSEPTTSSEIPTPAPPG